MSKKFKELFNAKSKVEMTIVKAQHQINLIKQQKIDL